jgi:protein-tyrosine sulfotransferase
MRGSDANRSLLRFAELNAGRCLSLRYEDLVANPEAQVTRILTFLGEPTDVRQLLDASMTRVDPVGLGDWKTYEKHAINQNSVGRWRALSETTVARPVPIVADPVETLGYEPVVTDKRLEGEAARHHYMLGRMVARMRSSGPSRETSRDAQGRVSGRANQTRP